MRNEPTTSAAVWVRVTVAILSALLISGCMGNGVDERALPPKASDGEQLADASQFSTCAERSRPTKHWKFRRLDPSPMPATSVNVGTWDMSWSSPPYTDTDDPKVMSAMILPTRGAAELVRDSFPRDDEVEGKVITVRSNVVLQSYDGSYLDAPPAKVWDMIGECIENASDRTSAAERKHVDELGKFRTCKPFGDSISKIRARGMSCSEAVTHLRAAEKANGTNSFAITLANRGLARASWNICCALFVDYAGDQDGEIVYESGI